MSGNSIIGHSTTGRKGANVSSGRHARVDLDLFGGVGGGGREQMAIFWHSAKTAVVGVVKPVKFPLQPQLFPELSPPPPPPPPHWHQIFPT